MVSLSSTVRGLVSTKNTHIFLLTVSLLFFSCSDKKEGAATKSEVERTGPLFTLMTTGQSGVNFTNKLPPETLAMNHVTYPYLFNGTGVSVGDINNDGLPDLYFTTNFGHNKLFVNRGNLHFEEIGKAAGVQGAWGWSTGTTMVDINSDGLLDIYVCRSGNVPAEKRKNELFVNNGNLTFTESAAQYGLDDEAYGTQAVFFDQDRDGDLDLYLVNHPNKTLAGDEYARETKKRNPLTSDKLYRNDNGNYTDISAQAGLANNGIGYGLNAAVGDLNNDGWPDIYVTNDYSEHDYLYINNKKGGFEDQVMEATRHISIYSMGSDIADFNSDGLMDIMVVDMVAEDNYRIKTNMSGMSTKRFYESVEAGFHYQYMMNTLQMNNGNGTFSDVSQLSGLSSTDWSWAPLWADFDNDGLQDLLVTNGLRKDVRNNDYLKRKAEILGEMGKHKTGHNKFIMQLAKEAPEAPIQNYIFKNKGNYRFENKADVWGLTEKTFSNGAAYADLDNDGDLEIIVCNVDQPALIYKNNAAQSSNTNYVALKLKGTEKNPSGIGARLTLKAHGKYQVKEHFLSRGYQSSVADKLHFGLGSAQQLDSLWVQWQDGNTQLYTNVAVNKTHTLSYSTNNTPPPLAGIYKKTAPLLKEVTAAVGMDHVHKENDHNDFETEILIPHKMSTLGPGMAVADVNGDGMDDFYIGGAKGFAGAMYTQQPNGKFKKTNSPLWAADRHSEDMAALFFDADSDGDTDLYVVSGGNEVPLSSPLLQDRLYRNDGSGNFLKAKGALPPMPASGSTVAAADYDNDGDTDLFVGGRGIPGSYPKPSRSYLLKNENGTFTDVTQTAAPQLTYPGIVTTAIWNDYNNDNKTDLILSGEWMPITVFQNNGGSFSDRTGALGLSRTTGWWYSLAAGDFDGDGDDDLMAGNLGDNYKYQTSPQKTFDLYYDDFDGNATGDIVLSYKENGKQVPLRGRECSSQQMPFIKEKFGTYDAFAKAGLVDVFGEEKLNGAMHLQAKTFSSTYIENTGNGTFNTKKLPRLAQLSSLNGILVKDVNADGFLDAIVSGNLYGSEVETTRNDAGNGLVLKGDGKGGFTPLTVSHSGFFAPNDSKQLHFITINKTLCVAVVNNNEKLQFFTFL